MTDIKDFYIYLSKSKTIDILADLLESKQLPSQIFISLLNYFIRGIKIGIFSGLSLLSQLIRAAIRLSR